VNALSIGITQRPIIANTKTEEVNRTGESGKLNSITAQTVPGIYNTV